MLYSISCHATRLAGAGAALLFSIAQVFGATYYVSSSTGSNSNSGTDTGHPWQTISKVSSPGLSYAGGDFILFKCGDTWKQGVGSNYAATLTMPNPGTSGHQITYGHYVTSGTCTTLPVIDANSAFAYAVSISKDFITLDGLQIQNSSSALVNFAGVNGSQFLNLTAKNGGIRGFYAPNDTGTTLIDHVTYSVDPGKHSDSNIIEIWSDAVGRVTITNNSFDRCSAAGTPAG
ncbi:MAG: hypothetical protein ACR2IV_07920, partial [Bryobacteraceae bacterium]